MSAAATVSVLTPQRRRELNRRSLHLAYATAGYNLAEGVVAVAAGAAASSTALLGFGLDSFIEVSSALVVIWQFRSRVPETRERLALRLIAVSFFALAAWIGVDAARSLLGPGEAEASPAGIGIAAVSVVVMPMLVWAKRRTGRELGSATVVADSTQTLLCTYLSAILLVGLLLNAWLGWSWADPIAGLIIAAVALREGVQAWRGEQCDDCAAPANSAAGPDGCADPVSEGVGVGGCAVSAGSGVGSGGCADPVGGGVGVGGCAVSAGTDARLDGRGVSVGAGVGVGGRAASVDAGLRVGGCGCGPGCAGVCCAGGTGSRP